MTARPGMPRFGRQVLWTLAAAFVSWPAAGQGPDTSRIPIRDYWVTDGPVYAVEDEGTTVYFGGRFDVVAPPNGSFSPVDGFGAALPGFPRVQGAVRAVVDDGTGGWVIGGDFDQVGGQPRSGLARILADGRVSSWNPGVDSGGSVHALARVGTTLYVGGSFSLLAGQSRSNLGAVSLLDDSTPLLWAAGTDGAVNALSVDPASGNVHVGGQFGFANGTGRCSAAAFDPSGALQIWDPDVQQSLTCGAGIVLALVSDGASGFFLGGTFDTVGGVAQQGLARVDATGARITNPGVTGSVHALAVSAGELYLGGAFSQVGVTLRRNLAALPIGSATPTTWQPDPDGPVEALLVDGSRLRVGGGFHNLSAFALHYGAAFSLPPLLPSDLDPSWRPTPAGAVLAFGGSGGRLAVGGAFGGIGGQERLNAAALDVLTGALNGWDPHVTRGVSPATVYAIEIEPQTEGPRVYLGGDFSEVGGSPRFALAGVDRNTGAVDTFFAGILAVGDVVYALSHDGSPGPTPPPYLYVGGNLPDVTACSPSCTHLLRVDPVVAAPDQPWSLPARANAPVRSIEATGIQVAVGGDFSIVGGSTRFRAAILDPGSGLANPIDPAVNGATVASVLPFAGDLLLGGDFIQVAGAPRLRAGGATYSAPSTLATPWAPDANNVVLALAPAPLGNVYVGGQFTSINTSPSVARRRLARVDGGNGADKGWAPEPRDGEVRALSRGLSRVTAGGSFTGTQADGLRSGLASFCESYPPPIDLTVIGTTQNAVGLQWTFNPSAVYRVFRSRRAGGPYQPLSPLVVGAGVFEDDQAEGGVAYFYVVRVEQGSPGPCLSDFSNEVSAAAPGACGLAPVFDGVVSAEWAGPVETFCGVNVSWRGGQSSCTAAQPKYAVYRSTSTPVTPDASNRVATLVGSTQYKDLDDVVGGATYYYLVRATDPVSGEEDQNGIEAAVTLPPSCGGLPTAPARVPTATVKAQTLAGVSSNVVTWLTPVTGGGDPNFCTVVCRGTPLAPGGCSSVVSTCGDAASSVVAATDGGLAPDGSLRVYTVFRTYTPSSTHTSRFVQGRPDGPTVDEAWAFRTSASALGTPILYPGVAYAGVSNDRRVYAMTVGAGVPGGLWPPGYQPPVMNAPAQSGPAFLPTTAALGSPALLVSSTDGRVYAFDATTGAQKWASPVLAAAVFARPTAMFSEAPGAVGDYAFVGTRDSVGPNRLNVLSLGGGTPLAEFPKAADLPGGVGPIHAPALVDYAGSRVFFASRQRTGSSTDTLWCMSLAPTLGEACTGWPVGGGVNVGEIDVALSLRNGRLFFATTAGGVGSVDAASGSDLRTLAVGASVKGLWTIDAGSGDTTVLVGTDLGLRRLSAPAAGPIAPTWGPVGPGAVSAPLVAPNNKIYVGAGGGALLAFDLATGAAAGSATLGDGTATVGSPYRDVSAGLLLVGASDGVIYALPVF